MECVTPEGSGCAGGRPAPASTCGEEGSESRDSADHTGLTLEGSGACGCRSAAEPSLAWLLLVLVVRRWPWVVWLLSPAAFGVDADRLAASDGRGWVAVLDGDSGDAWQARAALTGTWLRDPVVLREGDSVQPLVSSTSTSTLGASLTFDPRIRGGLALPIHPFVTYGDGSVAVMAPGDLAASLAVPLTPGPRALQANWRVGVEFPTGDPGRLAGGVGSVLGALASSWREGPWSAGGHVGLRGRPVEQLFLLRWGSAVEYGAAAGRALGPLVEVGVEAFGSIPTRQATAASMPLELLGTARLPAGSPAFLRLAGGAGLGRGVGNPSARALLAVEWHPKVGDRDGDGLADLPDRCPDQPEDLDDHRDRDGCPDPDNDLDGLLDAADRCPLRPEVANGWLDDDGCPDALASLALRLPAGAERVSLRLAGREVAGLGGQVVTLELPPGPTRIDAQSEGFLDGGLDLVLHEGANDAWLHLDPIPEGVLRVYLVTPDGLPVDGELVALQGERVVESAVAGTLELRLPHGPVELLAAGPGHAPGGALAVSPERGVVEVTVTLVPTGVAQDGRRLRPADPVRFDRDADRVDPGSEPALDHLAAWLLAHPEVRLLRVEGHADAEGPSRYNLDLSQRRAHAVTRGLVARGVSAERLQALGSGEATDEALAAERQVRFLVLVWDDAVSGATPSPTTGGGGSSQGSPR